MNVRPTYYPSSYNGPIKHGQLPNQAENIEHIIDDCDILINQNMGRISALLKRLVEIDEKIEFLKANI